MAKVAPMESAAVQTLPKFEIDMGKGTAETHDALNDYRLCAMPAPPAPGDAPSDVQNKTATTDGKLPGADPVIGGCLSEADAKDAASRTTKDSQGRITSYKDLEGHNFNMKYDSSGRLTQTMETDEKGNLRLVETVNYDDANGMRIKASVNFNSDGGLGTATETAQQFKDGKLVEEYYRDGGMETEYKFDEQGRETNVSEYNDGIMRSSLEREFQKDGNVSVKSTKYDEAGNKVGETQAVFDKDENHVGTEVSARFNEEGKETMRLETTYSADGKSTKVFENGEKTGEYNSIKTSRARDKEGDTIIEQHLDADGKPTETIEAKYFPRQPYLPTKITVKDADGNAVKTIDVNYLTHKNGMIDAAGTTARITDFSVTTNEGTSKHTFEKPAEQAGHAWKEVFKAADTINSFSLPIGRQPKASRIGAPMSYPVRGRTTEEALHDLPASAIGPA